MVRFRPKGRYFPTIVSFLLSSLLFLSSAAGHCAGHFYNVNAAEGIIGALSGNMTIWDLATSVLGAAGFLIVNEDIQNTASTHLGGNQYTLDYLVSEGLIEVNDQPSYTWDWSGLETLMNDWNNYQDSLPLNRIRDAAIESGIDFDNLWIDTFKEFVKNGKIGFQNIAEGLSYGISDFADWIGSAFGVNVANGTPITMPGTVNGYSIGAMTKTRGGDEWYFSFDSSAIRVYRYGSYYQNFTYANRSDSVQSVSFMRKVNGTVGSVFTTTCNPKENTSFNIGLSLTPYDGVPYINIYTGDTSSWINSEDDPVIQSPDILTTDGAAVYPSTGTWAPTPYLGGVDWPDAYLQPVPSDVWSPAIDDLIDAPSLPAPGDALDVFGGIFNPYIEDVPAIDVPGEEDIPIPTVAPRPTTAAGEGTMDVPYAVVPADPVPAMEDGAGQLPNIGEFFPFCIPGDFVYITKLLWSEDNVRTAPHIYLPLRIPSINFSFDIDIDFTPFDAAAELLRNLVLISFCIALAILTKNLIWS